MTEQVTSYIITERCITVFGMTEETFRGVEAALGLPLHALGQFEPTGLGAMLDENNTDGGDLDAAIAYVRGQGLAYEETTSYEAARA